MTKLDLIKEPKQIITRIDMTDPLFEQKLVIAKQEEAAVNKIVELTGELFGAKVEILSYNLMQGEGQERMLLSLSISRKEVERVIK